MLEAVLSSALEGVFEGLLDGALGFVFDSTYPYLPVVLDGVVEVMLGGLLKGVCQML